MKKGFTLIELLAVILVLAVIALISTPVVLDVVTKAKEKAAILTTDSYVKTIETELVYKSMNNDKSKAGTMMFVDSDPFFNSLQMSGQKPSSGIIKIDDNSRVQQADLCVGEYHVLYKDNVSKIVEGQCDFRIESSLTYKVVEDINSKNGNNNCTNENGVYSDKCYFTGDRNKITTNKILYTGLIWDIIGVEANGDLKLISEQPLTSISWGNYNNLNDSYVGKWLDEEFRDIIKNTDLEKSLKSITLLTAEEYLKYSGSNSYLDTRTDMWLKDENGTLKVVTKEGNIQNASYNEIHGIKPIVVIPNNFVSGSGTYDDMYEIVSDNSLSNTDNLKNGDFIKLSNAYTVRVIDNDNLKVILHGILNRQEGFNSFKYKNSNIERYLTQTFANEVGIRDYMDKSNHEFYMGNYNQGEDYNNVKSSVYNGYVALPTIGELFSGSDLFIQIQNTNNVVSYLPNLANQANNQWLLTPNSNGNYMLGYNGLERITNNNAYGIRPVFYLKNNLTIKSGDGSPKNPYILN